jgi:hypothetical protein
MSGGGEPRGAAAPAAPTLRPGRFENSYLDRHYLGGPVTCLQAEIVRLTRKADRLLSAEAPTRAANDATAPSSSHASFDASSPQHPTPQPTQNPVESLAPRASYNGHYPSFPS